MAPDLPPQPEPEQWLDGYRLERQVARGGMSEIWRAVHLESGQPVAVKRIAIQGDSAYGAEYKTRTMREARVLQSLDHENIVRCLEVKVDPEGWPCLVLEWLEGEDLATRHGREPLSIDEIVEVARQTLAGLRPCHELGLVHRDIKPANLFLVPSDAGLRVKLLDFGVALLRQATHRLTQTGAVIGTLHYLSPEQARGAVSVDHRTDLYSLGVVLYELTTGKLPFVAGHAAAVLLKIATETPANPRHLRPETPEGLARIIVRAMRRAPADRYQSAQEMLAALDEPDAKPTARLRGPERQASSPRPAAIERRLVSLLCVQVVHSADKSTAVTMTEQVGQAVQRFGGVVQPLLNHRVIGIFGLERTMGDETTRCLQAGIALRHAAGEAVQMIAATVNVAVGQGLQIDSEELDRTLAVMADLPRGELVVDEPTRRMAGSAITLRRVAQFDAVTDLRLEPGSRRAILGAQTPTVGRGSELAALRARVDQAEADCDPEAAVIYGPPGIGKSRLLSELLPTLHERSALCLQARQDSTRSDSPYSLVAEALRREARIQLGQDDASARAALEALFSRVAPGMPEEAGPFIGEAIGVPFPANTALRVARDDPKLMRRQVAQAFEAFFRAAGSRGLVSLCLDDLQWSDEESLRICNHLLEHLEGTPLFVLGACRPELLQRAPDLFTSVDALHQELRPLGQRSLRRLTRSILGGTAGDEVETLIADQWDGNPFFAEELVSWMVAGGVLVQEAGTWVLKGEPSDLEVPASLQAAIQGRIDRLPPELKDLLKASAVFGEVLWEDGCIALGHLQAPELLHRLKGADLVVPMREQRFATEHQWRFRHALLQQVAYEMLPAEQREEYHQDAARWLESVGERDAAVLARHFLLGGAPVQAAAYLEQAGARSLADGELEGAVRFYQQALAHDPQGEQTIERTVELARAYYLLGQNEQGLQAIEAIEADVDPDRNRTSSADRSDAAMVWLVKGRILFATAQYDQGEEVLRRALEAVPAAQSFEASHTLFWVLWAKGRYDEAGRIAARLYEQAQAEARQEQLCAAKLALAYCNVVEGDISVSLRLAHEAVQHARGMGHPYREVDSLLLLSSSQELAGQYEAALASLGEAHELATRLKTSYQLASIEVLQGRVHLLRGQLEQALACTRSAARRAEAVGDGRGLAQALVGQAKALYQEGAGSDADRSEAIQRSEQMARRALELTAARVPPVEAEAHAVLAQITIAEGLGEAAVEHAVAAVELINQLGTQEQCEAEILLVAFDTLRATGRAEPARQMLERASRRLHERSQLISDPAVVKSFLEKVPYHVRIRELGEAEDPQRR